MTVSPILSQARSFPQGRPQLVVTVRRSFSFASSGRPGASTLVEVPSAPLSEPYETAVNRVATDVVIHGHVVLRGARESSAEVTVAAERRVVRAFGVRTIESVAGGRVAWSAPMEAERVALRAANAYGGSWAEAIPDWFGLLGSAQLRFYPRNPDGRGFATVAESAVLLNETMPALEDPESPVLPENMLREDQKDWLDAPFPPLFSWMDPSTFPRCRFFGRRLLRSVNYKAPPHCLA